MKVFVYLRVSSLDQARQENPIESQKSACLEYAQRNNYDVVEIFTDNGKTGRNGDREAFQEMIKKLKEDKSVGGFVAYDISRIFRNGPEFFRYKDELKKHGKKIFTVSEPLSNDNSSSSFMLEWILAGFAEFRSRQDGEKIRLGMLTKGRSGTYPGYAPLGYKNMRERLPNGRDKAWMEKDPNKAHWITKAFEMFATGHYSLHSLADSLREEGFPTRTKRPLKVSTLERVLKNKVYLGLIEWGDITGVQGDHEPLVDEATFYKVQTILEVRLYGGSRRRKHVFLLRDLVYCGECGSRVIGAYHKGKKKHYAYYSCLKRVGGEPVDCFQGAWKVTDVEKKFQKVMKSVRIHKRTADRLKTKIRKEVETFGKTQIERRTTLKRMLLDIETKRRNLMDKYLEGKIEDDVFTNYKKELNEEENRTKAQLFEIEGAYESILESREKAIDLASDCYRAYRKADYDQKILLAKAFFEKLVVKDGEFDEIVLKEPFQGVLEQKTFAKELVESK